MSFTLGVSRMILTFQSFRAKYPLAIVEVLLEAFGLKIGGSYDIGCHFGMTLNNSELGTRLVPINSARSWAPSMVTPTTGFASCHSWPHM